VAIFRRSGEKHALAVAMTGVKLGDRLLHIGCSDASLLAALGGKVGLSGRACAIVASEADAARARRGAEQAGMLLELEKLAPDRLPYENESFDLIVFDNLAGMLSSLRPEQRVTALREVRRILAPRGRLVVIERAPREGLGALLTRGRAAADPHYVSSGGAATALKAEGFNAVRRLAERDGLSFFEGVR
jgi:ubiquinone/menaquinone biosynthesis C-methylase UbiE